MLNVIANNFGVPPAEMRIREYSSERLLILDGEFSVDTTDENYKAARYMTLTVPDLPFPKSRETTGFALIEVDGVRHITLTRCRVTDKNTIRIDKIIEYNAAGSYTVRLCSAFIPTCVVDNVALFEEKVFTPVASLGNMLNAECYGVETAEWVMFYFKVEDLLFDGDSGEINADLCAFPQGRIFTMPLIYNESYYDELGSKYIPVSVSGGVLTIASADVPEGIAKSGNYFCRMFLVK